MLMLRTSLRSAARVLVPRETARMSTLGGLKGYQEKEIGEETVYFHKEDEKLLKNLLKKVRAQATQNDAQGSAAATAQEIQELQKIVGSKLTEDEMRALIDWKHHH